MGRSLVPVAFPRGSGLRHCPNARLLAKAGLIRLRRCSDSPGNAGRCRDERDQKAAGSAGRLPTHSVEHSDAFPGGDRGRGAWRRTRSPADRACSCLRRGMRRRPWIGSPPRVRAPADGHPRGSIADSCSWRSQQARPWPATITVSNTNDSGAGSLRRRSPKRVKATRSCCPQRSPLHGARSRPVGDRKESSRSRARRGRSVIDAMQAAHGSFASRLPT